MTTGKAIDGKPYAGNPHVRFGEGEVASAAPRRGPLPCKTIMHGKFALAALSASLAVAASAEEMFLAPIFADHMVFAAGKPMRVFGTGDGEVAVAFRGKTVKGESIYGKWCVTLPAAEAGGPFELVVEPANGRRRVLKDVAVGEVLVMAGQSNMQFKLGESTTDPKTWISDPMIREFTTTRLEREEPYYAKDGWIALDKSNAGKWSAIGYETAIRRARSKGVPVGIINCYQGAAIIQAFMPEDLARSPRLSVPGRYRSHFDEKEEYYSIWNKSGTLYRKQFGEIVPFSASAVVWYQGEGNTGSVEESGLYAEQMAAMIGQWRVDLGDAFLPFVVVQIADFDMCRRQEAWRAMQAAQARVPELCPFVKTVKSADVCESDKGIHPPTKWRIAERVAAALE